MTHMMHKGYPKITNAQKEIFVDAIEQEYPEIVKQDDWTVLEKVHGTHYAIYVDFYASGKAYLKVAKRNEFLGEKEPLFNHSEAFKRVSFKIYQLAKVLKKDFIVFGELFGGYYDGVSNSSTIHKTTQYHPNNEFMVYDIGFYSRDGKKMEFMPTSEVIQHCEEQVIPHVPVLFKGTLQDCLKVSPRFISFVPQAYGLPELKGNFAKGIVIKPEQSLYLANNERIILNKNNVDESINSSILDVKGLEIASKISHALTDERLSDIITKNKETAQPPLIFVEAKAYLMESAIKASGIAKEYGKLSASAQRLIYRSLEKKVAAIVSRSLFSRKAG